jgi:hypothetical protein
MTVGKMDMTRVAKLVAMMEMLRVAWKVEKLVESTNA